MKPVLYAAALLLAACGYSSQSTVPAMDGRPRAVWREDHVAVDPAGAPLSPACAQQLGAIAVTDRLRLFSGDLQLQAPPPRGVFVPVAVAVWVPIYYGA